jgi:hypothetical protein
VTPPDKDLPNDDEATVDEALGLLIRAVLTPEERQLFAAMNVISDPKVRQSLIDIVCAIAGIGVRGDGNQQQPRPLNVERIRAAILTAGRRDTTADNRRDTTDN